MTKSKKIFFSALFIPLLTGGFSALLAQNGYAVYSLLNKPALSPPALVFPIVWTLLYILMGISSYLIYSADRPYRSRALKLYAVQLFFNFMWSILFFRYTCYLPAFLWIICLILIIALMIYCFYPVSPFAAYLQIPYFFWCIFAAYLNFSIYLLN